MPEPGRRWMSEAAEILSIASQLEMQNGQIVMVPQGGATGGLVRVFRLFEIRRMLILVTNPGERRARLKFTLRTETTQDDKPRQVVLTANGVELNPKTRTLQLDAHRTRVVEAVFRAGPRLDEAMRSIVSLEIESDRDVIPSGELRTERTTDASDLREGLPIHWDSRSITWFQVGPPPPQLPGGPQTTSGTGRPTAAQP
jgi:hypothetical protein